MDFVIAFLALAAAQDAAPPRDEAPAPQAVIETAPAPEASAPPGPRSSRDSIPIRLEDRLAVLKAAENAEAAEPIAAQVRSLWRQLGGPTAALLLERGAEASEAGDLNAAARQYFHLRNLEPDLSEAWMVSAELAARQEDWSFALEALERAVAIEPRRFDAYLMLGRALERANAGEAALAAYEAALEIHPHLEPARVAQARLERALAGRAL